VAISNGEMKVGLPSANWKVPQKSQIERFALCENDTPQIERYPSVRTICPGGEEQEVYITTNSRYGNSSVAAVFIAVCGRKCLKSRLFRAKEKGR